MVVAEILDAIQTALAQGNRVEIRGFGTCTMIYRTPRIGRNPKTGEPQVHAKSAVHFKAGKELKERVDTSK